MVMVAVSGIVVELVVVTLSVVRGLLELPLVVLNVVVEDVRIL